MRRSDLSLVKGNTFCSVESVSSFYDSDVLVIGAGLSGLTAAYKLCQKDDGLRVLVLDAKGRVGGRTLTVPLKTCDKTDLFDLGGQWVCSSQTHIINLLKELKLETYPQFDEGYKAGQAGTSMWKKFSVSPVFGTWYSRFELYQFILKLGVFLLMNTHHQAAFSITTNMFPRGIGGTVLVQIPLPDVGNCRLSSRRLHSVGLNFLPAVISK